MINLPLHPGREWISAFGLAFAATIGLVLGGALGLLLGLRGIAIGLLGGAGLAVSAVWFPAATLHLYQPWNRAARAVSRWLYRTVVAVSFFSIFGLVRLTGGGLRLELPAGDSRWIPKVGAPSGPSGPSSFQAGGNGRAAWIREYIRWAWNSGNTWSVLLLPFLILMQRLHPGRAEESGDIYTLF